MLVSMQAYLLLPYLHRSLAAASPAASAAAVSPPPPGLLEPIDDAEVVARQMFCWCPQWLHPFSVVVLSVFSKTRPPIAKALFVDLQHRQPPCVWRGRSCCCHCHPPLRRPIAQLWRLSPLRALPPFRLLSPSRCSGPLAATILLRNSCEAGPSGGRSASSVVVWGHRCPFWLVRIHKFKAHIAGPWDEAAPQLLVPADPG